MVGQKVVVFGHKGFAGRNVWEQLQQHASLTLVGASLRDGLDLRDPGATAAFLRQQQPTIIVNCAAHVGSLNYVSENAATVISDNSRMILGMYDAVAQECPASLVINPIANCAYPATADEYREDEFWNGPVHRSVLSYGTSRRLLLTAAECYQMQFGVRSINLLTPNMYGPYDSTDPNKAHALNALISKFVKAEHTAQAELPIWGTGAAVREWLYAPDFGRLVWEVIQNPDRPGLQQPLNLAQNDGLSIRELVELIQARFNYAGQLVWDASKPDGAPRKVMNDAAFRNVFPSFQFTDFAEGVARTVDYYESVYPY